MNKLAIDGGNPVRNSFIPYGKQQIDDEDIKAVTEVLKNEYITTGPKVEEFERKVAEYVGVKYAVAVSNGTAALHTACLAAGIKCGDEVIVPAISFVASANCVCYCGGKPIFVDVNQDTYNIDAQKISEKITSRTKAIIAVDYTGQTVDIDEIIKIAKEYNLVIIEDAAHALGSEYKGERIGNKANMTTFSFHPVKPITTGEGGMVVTNDIGLYKKIKLFRSHGITREYLSRGNGDWYYEQIELGYNYRITDIQCALGISQMRKINSFLAARRRIAKIYSDELSDVSEIIIPYESDWSNSGWHIYIIQLVLEKLKVNRKMIYDALRKENIGVNVHYLPIYLHPYYVNKGYKERICPIAENLYKRIITLPLYPTMSDEDIADVITAVKKVINAYRKG